MTVVAASRASLAVRVNGASIEIADGATLSDLLDTLGLPRTRIAVEHNRRVVPRAEHARLALRAGDELEIVTFVGGG